MSQQGPPYAPRVASLGGEPTVAVDVPILAVLIVLYMTAAAGTMTIFQINNRRGHKFLPSGALFGFCMARIATCVLRIAWATRQHNVRLAIAASIFVNAGILIVYVVNLVLAQRILRAMKPRLGWHPVLKIALRVLYALIGGALAMVITATVLTFYTLDMHLRAKCRDIQLAASTYLLVFTVLPLIFLAVAYLPPRSSSTEHFGKGSMQHKALVLLVSSCLALTISGFKTGTAWMPARPIAHPAWYQSKAAFYVFGFALEILILAVLIPSRIDKLFHVPNGSHGPGDYSRDPVTSIDEERPNLEKA